jgi:purine nucleoside phosphorylase
MTKAVLGIIGGSGIYDLPGLAKARQKKVKSPWGEPSAPLRMGEIAGTEVVFLSRHDRGHRLSPSDINYRANIDVLKRAGVTDLVSLSACGSFKQELPPGTFVLVDQFIDRTYKRESSFFGKGCVAHVSMAHPVSPLLQDRIAAAAALEGIGMVRGGTYVCMEGPQFSTLAESLTYKRESSFFGKGCVAHVSMAHPVSPLLQDRIAAAAALEGIGIVRGGTYVCMEGPQFSTLAESLTYKQLGYSVIGMTNLPEAKLAREAEISYATVAMVTDFDCWHPDHDAVTVQDIIAVLTANAEKAKGLVARLARDFPREHEPCPIGSDRALDTALITAPEARDPALLKRLDAVAGRVLKKRK